jgi:hypothetical protein
MNDTRRRRQGHNNNNTIRKEKLINDIRAVKRLGSIIIYSSSSLSLSLSSISNKYKYYISYIIYYKHCHIFIYNNNNRDIENLVNKDRHRKQVESALREEIKNSVGIRTNLERVKYTLLLTTTINITHIHTCRDSMYKRKHIERH